MKSSFYIFLILVLSFSAANAQERKPELNVATEIAKESNESNTASEMNKEVSKVTKQETIVKDSLDANTPNDGIARSSSDIRIYLNRVRNVDNLDLLFPKIYKEKVA